MEQASCLLSKYGQAGCPPHNKNHSLGILPVKQIWAGRMPTPQQKSLFVEQASCLLSKNRAISEFNMVLSPAFFVAP
ncbi:MAG: hypothetical protein EAZ09_09855 [Oscillatoriales cyanobacterium]|nr:MAG: hypothetical protein EAZ09_09855 [Oscillatoriales cyanobacterium]